MIQQDYQCGYTVALSPDEVLEHIANVPDWWVRNTEGSAKGLHDVFTVRFPGETWVTFEITEFVPGKKVVWHVSDSQINFVEDKSEWTGTDIVFEIGRKDDRTELRFTHVGLVRAIECYGSCSNAWAFYVNNSLYRLITTGKGEPDRKDTAGKAQSPEG